MTEQRNDVNPQAKETLVQDKSTPASIRDILILFI
jgi:hypothetical protein